MNQKKNTKLSIKNMTDDGVKTGIFTLLIEGQFIKLACEECIKIDPQAQRSYMPNSPMTHARA